VSRPFIELKGFGGVELEPGGQATVRFTLPADVLSFSGPSYQRVLEPGAVDVLIGASSAEMRLRGRIELVGTGPRVLGHQRAMTTTFEVIQPA
jgi:beta-glucosidase